MTSMADALRQATSVIAAAEIDRRVHAVSDDELMDVVALAGALLAPRWYDRDQVWRPATTSVTRLLDATVRRM